MQIIIRPIVLTASLLILLSAAAKVYAAGHDHNKMKTSEVKQVSKNCTKTPILCAKTMTTAFAPNGNLWRMWSTNQRMYYQISTDLGRTFGKAQQVNISPEKISARNENRPKIAFDDNKGVYLSWARSGKKRFTADVRFSYSADGGKTFSAPITVNNDNLVTGHSFNEMYVTGDGEVTIVWLDGRYRYQQRKLGNEINGSELYIAKANPEKKLTFSNEALASGTCVCCRIAIEPDTKGNLAIFWRHIFGDNIREFALITLDDARPELKTLKQISYDHWYIAGCPHQGGGISIDDNNRYHLTWYNQGDKGKGIFYAYSDNAGQTLSTPIAIGVNDNRAAHPHVSQRGNIVDIVWTEFDGVKHQLWHQQSLDGGNTFKPSTVLTESATGADRPFIVTQGEHSIVSWQRPETGHWLSTL